MARAPLDRRSVGVVVPLRSFALGKARLGERLAPAARVALARTMAERVLRAAAPRPVVVVSSDPEVVAWARAAGAGTEADPGSLDGAARAGRDRFLAAGVGRVVVAHADLPLAVSLDAVDRDGRGEVLGGGVAVLVPCHRGDGTPVLSIPSDVPFRFAYGPGSFARHRAAAHAAGLAVHTVRDPRLRFDVDVPDDVDRLEVLGTAGRADRP